MPAVEIIRRWPVLVGGDAHDVGAEAAQQAALAVQHARRFDELREQRLAGAATAMAPPAFSTWRRLGPSMKSVTR